MGQEVIILEASKFARIEQQIERLTQQVDNYTLKNASETGND